jgi:hypothetical protein
MTQSSDQQLYMYQRVRYLMPVSIFNTFENFCLDNDFESSSENDQSNEY